MRSGSVVVIVPVLRRPGNVEPLLASLRSTAPEARPLFVATEGDYGEINAIARAGADVVIERAHRKGDYARKINAGHAASTEEFAFLAADDLRFHPGWLDRALELFEDEAVGVVGTNDLGNARVIAGEHSTHSLVRRSYVEEFGTIDERGLVLHPGYWHEFVDDEFVETAKFRNAYAHAHESIVEHLHPNWGKGQTDDLYRMQRRRMDFGRRHYATRRHLWTSP